MSTDNEIANRLHQIFPNPQVAQRVVDIVSSKRPRGWSSRSYAPYFKEIYANEVKELIDKMIETGNAIVYRYSVWCTDETQISKNTLYHRVNQSIRYLIECLDTPEHHYARWYETVKIERTHGVGVRIFFITHRPDSPGALKAELVVPQADAPRWKREMEKWIEGDEVTPFVQEKLALTPDEVTDLKVLIAGLKGIASSITSTAVRLIRINE
jgi:hypothetical protein